MGKFIYLCKGAAAEYSKYAANGYVGCSNLCSYCYCKKGILKGVMGQDKPQLKKCFKNEDHAIEFFKKEVLQNKAELQKHGLFFSFTTDPLLPETQNLTFQAIDICHWYSVPIKILTKKTQWIYILPDKYERFNIAFGFTLTGHDELEPNASTNIERIEAMKRLKNTGFKTFGSFEPIIDFESTLEMIAQTGDCCDLVKIGLMSGAKYDKFELCKFMFTVQLMCENKKVYFKDSLLKLSGIKREQLPLNCVNRDYNLFQ